MTRVRTVSLVAVAALALVPTPIFAGGFGGRSTVVVVAPHSTVIITSPRPRVVVSTPLVHHRPRFPIVVATVAPPILFAAPPVFFAPPIFSAPPPVVLEPPPVAAPAAPPIPTLIEYATGWYQLRGDGVTVPYVWVWIPKPPPPPAAMAPPAVAPPPPAPAEPSPPPAPSPQSSGGTLLYRWTDEQGIAHWTDRPELVPEGARVRIERF